MKSEDKSSFATSNFSSTQTRSDPYAIWASHFSIDEIFFSYQRTSVFIPAFGFCVISIAVLSAFTSVQSSVNYMIHLS